MNTMHPPLADESDHGKYIIVKIPREKFNSQVYASLETPSIVQRFRNIVWTLLCLFALLIGLALGSIFHSHLLRESTDKPIWKSSALQTPDTH
jgi:hypothetical protein